MKELIDKYVPTKKWEDGVCGLMYDGSIIRCQSCQDRKQNYGITEEMIDE